MAEKKQETDYLTIIYRAGKKSRNRSFSSDDLLGWGYFCHCFVILKWWKNDFVLNVKAGRTLLKFVQEKTSKAEYPPISNKAVRWLPERGMAQDHEPVFKLPTSGYVNTLLRVWIKSAGLKKKINYHVSRHTAATLLLSWGVPVTTVQKIMGHADIRTTLRYVKVIDKNVLDAVEILDNLPELAC